MADLNVNLTPARYAYTPTDAIVGGETQVQYSTDGQTWKALRGVTAYGDSGETASFIDQTTIEDNESRYLAGKSDTPDKTFEGYLYPADTDQQDFLSLADQKANVLMSIFWKSGNAVTFIVALGGRVDPETNAESLLSWRVTGKQSGKCKRWSGLTVNSGNGGNGGNH